MSLSPRSVAARLWPLLLLTAGLDACTRVSVDLAGHPCDDGTCIAGYVCHPDDQLCVPQLDAGCDSASQTCWRDVATGEACTAGGAFLPCGDVTDCSHGCRTCRDGAWSACETSACLLGTLSDCEACGVPCSSAQLNANTRCAESVSGDFVCLWADACFSGYVDVDGDATNGCECHRTSTVDTCDGVDDNCDGVVDNVDLSAVQQQCDNAIAGAHVATWSCAGGCVVESCDAGYYDLDGDGGNGCEYACIALATSDPCDGIDNDCDGLIDEDGPDGTCGDGVWCPLSEACDDGFVDACGSCNVDCSAPGTGAVCGDGVVCPELETCDDHFGEGCQSCYPYRKALTVPAGRVAADLAEFPLLVVRPSDSDLAQFARDDGGDLRFTAADGVTVLPHELESFNGTTGALVAWVKVPTLRGASTNVIYLYYGKLDATPQANPPAVWSNGFRTVYHLDDALTAAAPQAKDSTAYAHDAVALGGMTGANVVAGMVGSAYSLNGNGQLLEDADAGAYINGLGAVTVSVWIKAAAVGTDRGIFHTIVPDNGDSVLTLRHDASGASGGGVYSNIFKMAVQADAGAGGVLQQYESDSFQSTAWAYVVLSWQSGAPLRFWIDGLERTATFLGTPDLSGVLSGSTTLLVGTGAKQQWDTGVDPPLPLYTWDGLLDEFRLAAAARDGAWIAAEYANQSSPTTFVTVGAAEISW